VAAVLHQQQRNSRRKGETMNLKREEGIIKYGIAWLLGVPLSLLVLIFLVMRGC
jgi:hypothetical protein